MTTSRSFPLRALFAEFQLDLATGELRGRNGASVRIQQQPLQVLRLLLEADGRVVSRDELRTALWREETFVDFEHSVNTAVKKLRKALEDSVQQPKFIETVPKVGYRFLVPVEWVTAGDDKHLRPNHLPLPIRIVSQGEDGNRLWGIRSALGMAAVAVGTIALVLLYRSPLLRSKAPEPSISLAVTSVGEKYSPSLSPDGKQLAFAWNGGTGLQFSIYVKLIGMEEPLRLTHQASIDFNPVWSPDGHYIVFCRINKKGDTGIYMVPALGGAERKIRDTYWEERDFDQVFWYFGRLSWSPDGHLLAFSDRISSNEPTSIYLLSLDSLSCRRLTSPGLPALCSRQMVERWHSTAVRKASRRSTPCLLREGRSDD